MQKMKSRLSMLCVMVLIIGTLAACGNGGGAGDDELRIGVVLKSLANPFYVTMAEAIEERAEELGVEVLIQATESEADAEGQMQIIEDMLVQQVDAILLAPNGSVELVPAVSRANEQGVPVVIITTPLDEDALYNAGAYTISFVGSDDYYGGRVAAQEMWEALDGSGQVAILEGVSGHESSVARVDGFSGKLAELGGIEIVASQPANWDQEQGYTVFQNILQANPDVDGVFAASDLMALGAVQAIIDAGMRDQITVIGYDASDDAKEAVRRGDMLGSIAQSPSNMGTTALETAILFLETGSCDDWIWIDVFMVSADTL